MTCIWYASHVHAEVASAPPDPMQCLPKLVLAWRQLHPPHTFYFSVLGRTPVPMDRCTLLLQVWQQRFELEQKEKESLQQHFNATIAGLQQSAVATAMLLDSSMHASDAPRSSHIGTFQTTLHEAPG